MEFEKKFLIWENGGDYTTANFYSVFNSINQLRKRVKRTGEDISQGYLPLKIGKILATKLNIQLDFEPVEARLRFDDKNYYFALKGNGTGEREEIEQEILDFHTFEKYWQKVICVINKKRLFIKHFKGFKLEIDLFSELDLILIEIEVESRELMTSIPILGNDVTKDTNYYERNLVKRLFEDI